MSRTRYLLAATLILVVAAFLRLSELRHYPPGLHYDEAADMLLARDIAFNGYNPFPVVSAYSGREALFYYLAVPLLRIIGAEVFATRLTSAFLGILTVAVTVALGRVMFRSWPHGTWIALLAGAWLAVNGAQIWLTRQGFRTSPQPLFEALSLWCLFIALSRAKKWLIPLLLSGFFAGISLYAYMAARIFPLWLVIPLCLVLIVSQQRVLRLRQLFLLGIATLMTALPIGIFYAMYPQIFLDRLSQVADGDKSALTFAQVLRLHAEMFFIQGDPLLRYNLSPGRPWFDPISGVLMLLGLLSGVIVFLRAKAIAARAAGIFIALSPLLIVPSILAVSGLPPSHMRSVAMVPLIFFAPALGVFALHYLSRPNAKVQSVILTAAVTLIAIVGAATWSDYRMWASRADVFYDADGDLQLAAQWIVQHVPAEDIVYISSVYYEHPTVLSYPVLAERVRWQMAEHLFLPPPHRRAVYIFPRSVRSQQWQAYLQEIGAERLDTPLGADDAPAFAAYRLDGAKLPQITSDLNVNFDNVIRLRDVELPKSIASGEQATAWITWEIEQPFPHAIEPVFSLQEGVSSPSLIRAGLFIQQPQRWIPKERLIMAVPLHIPVGEAPNDLTLTVLWNANDPDRPHGEFYERAIGPLKIIDAKGRFKGILYPLGKVEVLPGALVSELPPTARQISAALAVELPPTAKQTIWQGNTLNYWVRWYAMQPPKSQPDLVAMLIAADGARTELWRGQPANNRYPFSKWRAGEMVLDRYSFQVPPNQPDGAYVMRLSLGNQPILERQVEIMEVSRNFEPPTWAIQPQFSFGGQVRLIGYEITAQAGSYQVRLAWKVVQPLSERYTVTVQALNQHGVLLNQHDAPLAENHWNLLPGEIIISEYRLPKTTDDTQIIVALYVPQNGLRLPVENAQGEDVGDTASMWIR